MKKNSSQIKKTPISGAMRKAYLDYAMSVIVSRALPDVRDGLKPVQRRIIYAMHDQGLGPKDRYQKSASVVGEVLKKYHPHGDAPVYNALVRMAQPFSLRYPLISGQGNFGSVDGDAAAAMRYTEARLAPISSELLKDLDKETVPFSPNYSGTTKEPDLLSSRLPNFLLNGTTGIAVAMATSIPPHNLGEVVDALSFLIQRKLEEKEVDIEELMEFIQGPDFPTGGIIFDQKEIIKAYTTGKGKILVRGKAKVEEKEGEKSIVITEIPYLQNKAQLVAKIAYLVEKGKIKGVSALRDESDREGLRIVAELKKGAQAQRVLAQLFRFTPLETTFNANMVGLLNGRPKLFSLKEVFEEFINHREEVVTKRTSFLLRKTKARAHILSGLKIALQNLDEVIALIKKSKDSKEAKDSLMETFELSSAQAQAVLDMPLRRLSSLEREKIEEELTQTKEKIQEYQDLLASPQKILKTVQKELLEIKEKYADERRTEVHKGKAGKRTPEDLIPKKETLIVLSQNGYVKRVKPASFTKQNRGGKGVLGLSLKEGDVAQLLAFSSTLDKILFFGRKGKVYELAAYELPPRSRRSGGRSLINFLRIKEPACILPLKKDASDKKSLIFATKKGKVKRTNLSEFENIRRGGIQAVGIVKKDELLAVARQGDENVILVTKKGKAIRFEGEEIRSMGRQAGGVRGIKLSKEDEVVALINCPTAELSNRQLLTVTELGYGKKTELSEYPVQGRGGKGLIAARVSKKTGPLAGAALVNEESEVFLLSQQGQVIRLSASDISTMHRATYGVRLMRLEEGDQIAALAIK